MFDIITNASSRREFSSCLSFGCASGSIGRSCFNNNSLPSTSKSPACFDISTSLPGMKDKFLSIVDKHMQRFDDSIRLFDSKET